MENTIKCHSLKHFTYKNKSKNFKKRTKDSNRFWSMVEQQAIHQKNTNKIKIKKIIYIIKINLPILLD